MLEMKRLRYPSFFPLSPWTGSVLHHAIVDEKGQVVIAPPDRVWRSGEAPVRVIGHTKWVFISEDESVLLHEYFLRECADYQHAFTVYARGSVSLSLSILLKA